MTLNELTVNFSHLDRNTLLSDWEWLLKGEFLPILLSASGDAFVQSTSSGEVWWLDSAGAEFTKVSDSPEAFTKSLSDKKFVVECFAVQMVGDLIRIGKKLKQNEIYSLSTPWLLGGNYELSNIEPTNIEVHFSLTGQIAKQIASNGS